MNKIICRVCLLKCPSSPLTHPLADKQTRKMLFECTSVLVTPGDRYPQQMCGKCLDRCTSWADFKALAQDSDRQLKYDLDIMESDEEEDIAWVKEEPLFESRAQDTDPQLQTETQKEPNEGVETLKEDRALAQDIGQQLETNVIEKKEMAAVKEEPLEEEGEFVLEKEEINCEVNIVNEEPLDEELVQEENRNQKLHLEQEDDVVDEEENILTEKEELMDEDEGNTMEEKEEPLEKELVQENRDADRLKLQNGSKKMCEREEVPEKEEDMDEDEMKVEQLDYLQGYSLAPESADEEDSIPSAGDSEIRQNKAPKGPSPFKANKCGYCAKTFSKLASLVAHVRVHKNNFECSLCSKTFRSNNQLKVHRLTHNAIKTIGFDKREPMCTPETNSANHKLLVLHNIEPEGTPVKWTAETTEGHSVKVSKCGYCAKTFSNLGNLIAHARVHANEKTFQSGVKQFNCDKRETMLKSNTSLDQHEFLAHGIKCGKCCKMFANHNQLNFHQLLAHTPILQFNCDKYDTKCQSRSKLSQQNLMIHNSQSYKCDKCNTKFSSKALLANHKRSQTNVRAFECDQCDKKFTSNHQLNVHVLAHNAIKTIDYEHSAKHKRKSDFSGPRLFHRDWS